MVFKRIKKKMKQAKETYQRGLEAERIYKRERELAYAQAERRKALKLAEKGEKPKKKGFDIMGTLEMLTGSTASQPKSDPLGLFGTQKKRKSKKTKKRRKKR